MDFDRELIQQSIAKQYHILPSQQGDLKYSDWVELVGGLMDDTPLGRTVQIRIEKNDDIIREFSPSQRKIRKEWADFLADQSKSRMDEADYDAEMRRIENMIAQMFGGDAV